MRTNWKLYKAGQYCLIGNEDVFIRDYSTPESPLYWWCVEHQGTIADGETDSFEEAQDLAEMALARLKKSYAWKNRLAKVRSARKDFQKARRVRFNAGAAYRKVKWESRMSFFAWWDCGVYAYDMLRYQPAGARPVGLCKRGGG